MPLVIFAVALAVRLVHIWQIKPSPFFDVLLGDAHAYDAWARRLAAGDWIGTDVFYQAPLYPYFLGVVYTLVGPDLLVVRLIQAVIGSASCVLLALAGERLFSRPAGLVAGFSLALYAPAIFFDALLQKSVLDMFFVCLGLWLMSRILTGVSTRGSWIALGLAMGGLALTRENGLVMSAVILAWTIVWSPERAGLKTRLYGRTVFFVVGLAIVLVPVAARNYAVGSGVYLTTSQFGPNFYIGNHEGADGTYVSLRPGRGAPEFERRDATEVAEEALGRTLTPSGVSAYWTGRALSFIASRPGEWVALMGRKALLLVNASEMFDTESQESYAEWSWPLRIGGVLGHFGLLIPLAMAGVVITWPSRRRLWVIYALALAYAASVVVFYVFARYRYPLVPFLLLFAAPAVLGASRFFRTSTRGPRLLAGAGVVVAAVVANLPLLSPQLMQAITETNLGAALQELQQFDRAITYHQRAIAAMPDYAPAHNNLGAALRAVGRLDEAIAHYQRAIALDPRLGSASSNLAMALLTKGQTSDSVEQFRKALQASPNSVAAHNNFGLALAAAGDAPGAMAEFRAAIALDDRSVHAHRNLGNMLVDMGSRAEGLAHLERAVQVGPGEADALLDIGSILLGNQDFAGAAERFRAALRVKPDSPEILNNLGIALASQGRLADALTYFEAALKLRPDFADALANRDQARAALKQ